MNRRSGVLALALAGALFAFSLTPAGAQTTATSVHALRALLSKASATTGAALVGFLQSGTGATARTVKAKLQDVASVKDFGAVGDGVADDTAAIEAADAAGAYIIPAGTYKVKDLDLTRAPQLMPGAVFEIDTGASYGIRFQGNHLDTNSGTVVGKLYVEHDYNEAIVLIRVAGRGWRFPHVVVNGTSNAATGLELRNVADSFAATHNVIDWIGVTGCSIGLHLNVQGLVSSGNYASNNQVRGGWLIGGTVGLKYTYNDTAGGAQYFNNHLGPLYIEDADHSLEFVATAPASAGNSGISDKIYFRSDGPDTNDVRIDGFTPAARLKELQQEYTALTFTLVNSGSSSNMSLKRWQEVLGDSNITMANLTADAVSSKRKIAALNETSTQTIATGAITPTRSYTRVDTEAAAATDDLDTINGGADGEIMILQAANSARTVVVKDATGNINLIGSDFSLDHNSDKIGLVFNPATSQWEELFRANNGT